MTNIRNIAGPKAHAKPGMELCGLAVKKLYEFRDDLIGRFLRFRLTFLIFSNANGSFTIRNARRPRTTRGASDETQYDVLRQR